MSRPVLDPVRIHPAIEDSLSNFHADILHNVQAASNTNPVLVVGMAGNPFCRRARKTLDKARIPYQYLEYGSYFSQWKQRLALKMWSGWPTFPMVFAKGVLIGGANDLDRLVSSGELQRLLGS
ncbi:MAG: glutaredoxin [Rhizobacter sp.]|nr:glutaredoxin [Rhizobacter sp.]